MPPKAPVYSLQGWQPGKTSGQSMKAPLMAETLGRGDEHQGVSPSDRVAIAGEPRGKRPGLRRFGPRDWCESSGVKPKKPRIYLSL